MKKSNLRSYCLVFCLVLAVGLALLFAADNIRLRNKKADLIALLQAVNSRVEDIAATKARVVELEGLLSEAEEEKAMYIAAYELLELTITNQRNTLSNLRTELSICKTQLKDSAIFYQLTAEERTMLLNCLEQARAECQVLDSMDAVGATYENTQARLESRITEILLPFAQSLAKK